MEDKNLTNLIKHQQEKIDSLEQDKKDLFTGYMALVKSIKLLQDEITTLKGGNNGN